MGEVKNRARRLVIDQGESRPSPGAPGHLSASILDQLSDALIATDLNGNITACNNGVSLYGYTPDELVGRNMSGLYRPEEQAFLLRQVIPNVIEKGRFQGELRARAKSGEEVYVYLSITLIRDSASVPVGMLVLAINLTDKKLAEKALERGTPQSEFDQESSASNVTRREVGGDVFIIASPLMHKFMGM